jgi:hypothetical protein
MTEQLQASIPTGKISWIISSLPTFTQLIALKFTALKR